MLCFFLPKSNEGRLDFFPPRTACSPSVCAFAKGLWRPFLEKLHYLRGTGLGFGWGKLRWGQAAQGDAGQEQGRGRDAKAFPVEGQPAHGNTFRLRCQGGPSGKKDGLVWKPEMLLMWASEGLLKSIYWHQEILKMSTVIHQVERTAKSGEKSRERGPKSMS